MDRNQKILAALGVVFMLTLGYRILAPYEQPTVATLKNDGQRPAGRRIAPEAPSKSAEDALVLAESYYLNPQRLKADVKRDPFSKAAPPPASPRPALQPRTQAPIPQTPEGQIRNAFSRFKVFGSFRQESNQVLFLQRGKQVILVRKGDLIDGQYTVKDFADNNITVTSSDVEAPVLIQLEEMPDVPGRRFFPTSRPEPVAEEPEPPPSPEDALSEIEPDEGAEDEFQQTSDPEASPGEGDSEESTRTGTGLEPSFPVQTGVE